MWSTWHLLVQKNYSVKTFPPKVQRVKRAHTWRFSLLDCLSRESAVCVGVCPAQFLSFLALIHALRWTENHCRTFPCHGVMLFGMSVQKQPTMGLGGSGRAGFCNWTGAYIGPSLTVRVEQPVNQSVLVFKHSAQGWKEAKGGWTLNRMGKCCQMVTLSMLCEIKV